MKAKLKDSKFNVKNPVGEKFIDAYWDDEKDTDKGNQTQAYTDYLGLIKRADTLEKWLFGAGLVLLLLVVWNCFILAYIFDQLESQYQEKMNHALTTYSRTYNDQNNDISNLRQRMDHTVGVQDALFKYMKLEAFKPIVYPEEWKVGKIDPKNPRRSSANPTGSDLILQEIVPSLDVH